MMAEKEQQPIAPSNGYARSDEEAARSKELRRKKRMKCLAYVVAFAVFQTGIILLFALTVMKIRTPKFRVRSATFETITGGNSSFNLKMSAELGVKNTNFGHFKYENSTITFSNKGVPVGSASVPKARARARSTKKFTIVVNLELGNDPSSGLLTLTSQSKLVGKVHLMKVIKKKKNTDMSCNLEINTTTKQLQSVTCK